LNGKYTAVNNFNAALFYVNACALSGSYAVFVTGRKKKPSTLEFGGAMYLFLSCIILFLMKETSR
jgi:hypothetical protein